MALYSHNESLSITDALATTQEVIWGDASYGMVFIPAGSSITSLTFSAAPEPGGTYLAAYVAAAAVVLTVQAGRCYQIPTSLSGARAIKMVGNVAGTIGISIQSA
jgi:hypothetical protein